MKYLIIFVLIVLFWTYILWRLRPYIRMARRVLGMVRDVQRVTHREPTEPLRANSKEGQQLVRCASCDTWTPSSRAVRLRSHSASYCSHECLERAAGQPQRARRSS